MQAFVAKRGGALWVWTEAHRCCTGVTVLLEAETQPPGDRERPFVEYDGHGFVVLLDTGGRRPPDELVLELRGIRRKVVAFWDDLAWVE